MSASAPVGALTEPLGSQHNRKGHTVNIDTELRNGTLLDLKAMLEAQDAVKYDVVASASKLVMRDGTIVVNDSDLARLTPDGVTIGEAVLRPTDACDGGIAEKLGIPVQYLRRLRETAISVVGMSPGADEHDEPVPYDVTLLDANVNGMLQANPHRKFLVRGFRESDSDTGIARAFLSDSFSLGLDHLDVITAVLQGVRDADVDVDVQACDLSEKSMRVRLVAPQISALAPTLLKGYRSPYTGNDRGMGSVLTDDGKKLPIVFAGIDIRNSETGHGAAVLTPRITVKICGNGMTMTKDAMRSTHVGSKLEEGVVTWSRDTEEKELSLITAKARDAVRTYLDVEYIESKIAEIEAKADVEITDAVGTIERVAQRHAFTERERASIFDCFVKSGQLTAGGVMQAVTAAAQRIESPDRAAELEDVALDVLNTAHALAVSAS